MSSQDTMSAIQSAEEAARVLQSEIDSNQADMDALSRDIQSKANVNQGLEERRQHIVQDVTRLRQQYTEEQNREQQEQLRQQQDNQPGTMEKVAKETIRSGLFG